LNLQPLGHGSWAARVTSTVAGLPLGIAAGRWSWALFAHGLGIPAAAITAL
jgi:hypothetical protein